MEVFAAGFIVGMIIGLVMVILLGLDKNNTDLPLQWVVTTHLDWIWHVVNFSSNLCRIYPCPYPTYGGVAHVAIR